MQVFIAGATGVLGRRLVAELAERGHEAVGLVRDDAGAEAVEDRGGTPRRGDLLDRDSVVDAAAGADVVVHAATAIPTKRKPTAADWEPTNRLRREGTRNLTAAAAAAGADRYLQQSVAWVARRPDGEPFDESSPPNPDRTTQAALDGERLATRAGDEHGFDVGVLRGGWFYAADAAHTRQFGRDLLARRLPIVGGGLLGRRDAELSTLHVADAAAAFADAAESEATGRWHVVDDEPVAFAAFLRALADRLDAPDPRRVPGWLVRPVVGKDAVRLVTNPMPTSNDRFREEVGWEPRYSTYREGLDEVVEAWREEGALVETGDGYRWAGD